MKTYTRLLTRETMAECDKYTIDALGIPSRTLMERAARGVISYMRDHESTFPYKQKNLVVLCGSGNNGGDGFAIARFLSETQDTHISVCYVGKRSANGTPDVSAMSQECARQYELLKELLTPIFSPRHMDEVLKNTHVIIDAMLGIGLDRPVQGELAELIRLVNESGIPILAVDIPTGICANSGAILGDAIRATATVTMQAPKVGMLCYPATELCGNIYVCDIGITLSPADQKDKKIFLANKEMLHSAMPPRSRRTHKGTYGQLALLCGSEDMCGAAILAAKGALRSGVGLLRVVTPSVNKIPLHTTVPEAILTTYQPPAPPDTEALEAIVRCNGAVVGCGMGTTAPSLELLRRFLDIRPLNKPFPVVLDADALNLLAKHPDLWDSVIRSGEQTVITPHPAEFSRLSGLSVSDILADPVESAASFAKKNGVVVVLKDAHTVIASHDGSVGICPYGNAGMAKGGCGDVLAGIIGSLLVQNRAHFDHPTSLWETVCAGVVLHGLAGDAAAQALGEYAMSPSDITDMMGLVTREFSNTRTNIDSD